MNPPRPPIPWDAVLFDLDGTLADTVPLILTCWRHMMAVHRPHETPDESLLLAHVGRTLRDTMREFAHDEDEALLLTETYVGRQRELHDEMVKPFPGALTRVERLRRHGVPIAIVTSKGREMALRTMNVCGLDPHFTVVVTASDVERGKPDPEPVVRALAGLGVEPGPRVIFVGDSPHDIAAGKAAGVRTVGVSWGATAHPELAKANPDWLVRRFDEFDAIEP